MKHFIITFIFLFSTPAFSLEFPSVPTCTKDERLERLCVEDPNFWAMTVDLTDAINYLEKRTKYWVNKYPKEYGNLSKDDLDNIKLGYLYSLDDHVILVYP